MEAVDGMVTAVTNNVTRIINRLLLQQSTMLVYYQPTDDLCKCIGICGRGDLFSQVSDLLPQPLVADVTECIEESLKVKGMPRELCSGLREILGPWATEFIPPLWPITIKVLAHRHRSAHIKELNAQGCMPFLCPCVQCLEKVFRKKGSLLLKCLWGSASGECCTSLLEGIHGPLRYPVVFSPSNGAACIICMHDFVSVPTDLQLSSSASFPTSLDQQDLQQGSQDSRQQQARPDVLRRLRCGHIFHVDCADEWLLNVRMECPTCRRPVSNDD